MSIRNYDENRRKWVKTVDIYNKCGITVSERREKRWEREWKKKSALHEMLTGIGAMLAGIAALITAIASILKD